MSNPFLRIVQYVIARRVSAQEAAESLETQRRSIEHQRATLEAQLQQIRETEDLLKRVVITENLQ